MNLDWIPKTLRLRTPVHEQLGRGMETASKSDLVEALMYLRRASELLAQCPSWERVAVRIDRVIAELRDAIASRHRH